MGLKYDTNEVLPMKQKQTHKQHTCACQGRGGGEGTYWDFLKSQMQMKLMYRIDNQEGPNLIAQWTIFNILW